jgi:hypothetical protein
MKVYIFSAHYYHDPKRLIRVKASTRTRAYDVARKKAIKIKNDLDIIELDTVED